MPRVTAPGQGTLAPSLPNPQAEFLFTQCSLTALEAISSKLHRSAELPGQYPHWVGFQCPSEHLLQKESHYFLFNYGKTHVHKICHFNHFKTCNSVASSTFMMSYHRCPILAAESLLEAGEGAGQQRGKCGQLPSSNPPRFELAMLGGLSHLDGS